MMNTERGRNRQQPEYLNERDASEDSHGTTSSEDQSDSIEERDKRERETEIAVRNALRH